MIIKPIAERPDWFRWHDLDIEWARAYGQLPGLQLRVFGGKLVLDYHLSHVPCLPEEAQITHGAVEQARQRSVVLPFEGSGLLRPYQYADLQRLKLYKGALLAYEMRCGKTPLACHLHDPAEGILLVVAPLAAREVWQDWIERVTGVPPILLQGRIKAEPAPGYPAYFCHYDVLEAHTPFLTTERIGTIVLDECHVLQNASRRLNAVNACMFRAQRRLGLSGTPMYNRPESMWRLLHLLTPGAWGGHFAFAQRYCDAQPGAYGWTYDGQSNVEEFAARLATVMIRRTWAEITPELPPTTRVIEPVELTGTAYATIEAAAMKAALASGVANQGKYQAILRRKLAEAKIKPAKQMAENAMRDGHKVIMWVWHVEIGDKVQAAMTDAGHTVYRLQAVDDDGQRQAYKEAFRTHDGPCVLVCSMGVGGVALDLSASDYAIFVELDWTPANVQQAEARTKHVSRPHVVVYLHTDDPVETKLIEALDVKNEFAAAVGLGSADVARMIL
jgi:superfamily II DNA or RNA helicase